MASGAGRRRLGRLLVVLGAIWVLWVVAERSGGVDALLGPRALGAQLPVLPGLAMLIAGRVIARRAPGPSDIERVVPMSDKEKRAKPARSDTGQGAEAKERYLAHRESSLTAAEMEPEGARVKEAIEHLAEEIIETVEDPDRPKTSEEMVEAAKRRWVPRRR